MEIYFILSIQSLISKSESKSVVQSKKRQIIMKVCTIIGVTFRRHSSSHPPTSTALQIVVPQSLNHIPVPGRRHRFIPSLNIHTVIVPPPIHPPNIDIALLLAHFSRWTGLCAYILIPPSLVHITIVPNILAKTLSFLFPRIKRGAIVIMTVECVLWLSVGDAYLLSLYAT